MAPRWVGFVVFIGIVMAIVGAAAQGDPLTTNVSSNSTMDPDLDYVLSYQVAWQSRDWGVILNPITNARFLGAIGGLLVAQRNLHAVFPEGTQWIWIWFLVWIPIVATVIFGIYLLFISIIRR